MTQESSDTVSYSFADKLAAKLAEKGRTIDSVTLPGAKVESTLSTEEGFDYSGDIPTDDDLNLSEEEMVIDNAIESLDIVDAYNRWSGKRRVNVRAGLREGIKASCPDPHHRDDNPSMWMNRDKNIYYCSGCEYGGDVFDIAAFHFGYSVPGYKLDPEAFRELREKMALDLGYSTAKGISGRPLFVVEEPEPGHTESTVEDPTARTYLHPSGAAAEAEDEAHDDDYNYSGPGIDWRLFVPPQTFLHDWMTATTQDNCPEEFHFWTGLMAIGFAIGRNVVLQDAPKVVSNLFVCLTGPSSTGKSRAKRHLKTIIQEALPIDYSDPLSQGVDILGAPGSGEYLVKCFERTFIDPSMPTAKEILVPVRGYIDYEEFSTLAITAGRAGSTLKSNLLDIYDAQQYLVGGSLTHKKRTALNPFGQVISSTQPDYMSKILSSADDVAGFVNRWIFAVGKPKPILAWGSIEVDFEQSIRSLKSLHMWGSTSKTISMSPEAMDVWSEFFFSTLHPMKVASEKKGTAVLGRIDLLLKKIMLLLTANLKSTEVSADTVRAAISVFPYLVQTFGRTSEKIKQTDEFDLSDLIIRQIRTLTKKNGKPPTKRDLYLACKSRIKTNMQMVTVLKNLVTLELIDETQYKPKTGRPTVRYSVAGTLVGGVHAVSKLEEADSE